MSRELTVVLGGAGRVGAFIAGLLDKSGYRHRLVDLTNSRGNEPVVKLDVLNPSCDGDAILHDATAIVFALPASVAIRAIPWVLDHAPKGVRLMPTCSVQEPFFRACQAVSTDHAYVGINLLFSPALNPVGKNVAICLGNIASESTYIERCFSDNGMHVKRMTPMAHDQAMAVFQALPHAAIISVGLALKQSTLDLDTLFDVMPPPMRTMFALLSRLQKNSPDVYWEIQRGTRHATEARAHLVEALERLNTQINLDHYPEFCNGLDDIARTLGGKAPDAAHDSERIFDIFRDEAN